jgi:succinate dehydrogenase / fumarate reductase flavoprotein subunit
MIQGPGTIEKALPAMVRQYKRFNIDLVTQPILVYPTLHYQNGGIRIDADCRTKIPGLFIGGEASGGVHGRNRLMGNSLLDVCVFGRRAGLSASDYVKDVKLGTPTVAHLAAWNKELDAAGIDGAVKSPILLPSYARKA